MNTSVKINLCSQASGCCPDIELFSDGSAIVAEDGKKIVLKPEHLARLRSILNERAVETAGGKVR